MSFLSREYKIPFLGKIKFINASGYDKSFNGDYYAENNKLGKPFVKKCNSLEELQEKVLKEIKRYFNQEKKSAELTRDEAQERINSLESELEGIETENWLQNYKTDNPLQLDLQELKKKLENKN